MSTIKSSADHLTLSSDGSGKEVKFQIDGVQKASISSAGAFTSTTIDATKLTGDLPAISGANLTGVGVSGITSAADATAITINSSEQVGIGTGSPTSPLHVLAASAGQTVAKFESNQAGAVAVEIDADADRDSFLRFQEAGTTRWDFFAQGSSGTNELNIREDGGNNVIRMTQSGAVTMPLQPFFWGRLANSATKTAGWNTSFGHYTQVVVNRGSHYNTSTGNFTCPVAGDYEIAVGGFFSTGSDGTRVGIEVKKNGSSVQMFGGQLSDGDSPFPFLRCIINCSANDTLNAETMYTPIAVATASGIYALTCQVRLLG